MEIIRNRTIRPSGRKKESTYKIDIHKITREDTLRINLDHESKPFFETYIFEGIDLLHIDSIYFKVIETRKTIQIDWIGLEPEKQSELKSKNVFPSHLKNSFDPITDSETQILILGTMPGDKSLELQEYYGHPQNRFWRTLACITRQEQPLNYEAKKALLYRSKIGVWDVAHHADRKGSLDSAIKDEVPNDLDTLINTLPKLKTICFNGKTAEKLFDKYFKRRAGITYLSLPSTSPANAGISLEGLCEKWNQILIQPDTNV